MPIEIKVPALFLLLTINLVVTKNNLLQEEYQSEYSSHSHGNSVSCRLLEPILGDKKKKGSKY